MTIPIVGKPFTFVSNFLVTNIVCHCRDGMMTFLVIFGMNTFTQCPHCKKMYGVQSDSTGQPQVVVSVPTYSNLVS